MWKRVLAAVKEIQRREPREGEKRVPIGTEYKLTLTAAALPARQQCKSQVFGRKKVSNY